MTKTAPRFFAFNWSPDPSRFPSKDPVKQYATMLSYLRMAPKLFDEFCFIPELNSAGNVHIHGYYSYPKDAIKFYRKFLPMIKNTAPNGFRSIPVTTMDDWQAYMMKDYEQNKYLFCDFYMFHDGMVVPKYMLKKKLRKKKNYRKSVLDYFK